MTLIRVHALPARARHAASVAATMLLASWCVADDPPTPVISILSTEGMAPFAVHVHAINTELGGGSLLNARFEWDFGDPDGAYDRLDGFNAAHLYTTPGTYELTLRATNREWLSSEASVTITVLEEERRRIYVAPDGDDASDGATPEAAVRTAARAFALLDDDTEILFRRDAEYPASTLSLDGHRNVHLRAWGDGERPVLRWNGGATTFAAILAIQPESRDIVVEHLEFDSPYAPTNEIVRGIAVRGENVTVRRCRFDDVSSAIMAESAGVDGLLTQDNTAGMIGAYFVWGGGTGQTHLGNTVAGSVDQQNMRFVGDRILVAHNDLTNNYKSCVWFQIGNYAYLAENKISEGPAQVGPIPHEGDPGARWRWAVMERNRVSGDALKVLHGATNVVLRNNVCLMDGGRAIEILGQDPVLPRTTTNIDVLNNTAINMSAGGKFVEAGPDAVALTLANNLYVAPNLATGSSGTANVYVADSDLSAFSKLRNNLWATPQIGWGDGVHYVWPYWSHPSGYKSVPQWADYAQTTGEQYHEFVDGDLDSLFVPQFDAETAVAVAGVFIDLYGNPRPQTGPMTAGAVQVVAVDGPPGGGDDTSTPPGGGDDDTSDGDGDGDGGGDGGDGGGGDGGGGDGGGGDGGGGDGGDGGGPEDPEDQLFVDDFEEPLGWAEAGIWERGLPAGGGLNGDPLADVDGSGQCYLTGNAPGDSDVDAETARLASPMLDAASAVNPTIRYAVWFHSGEQEADGGDGTELPEDPLAEDEMEVRISNDGGASWTFVERIPPTQGWWIRSFRVADYVVPTHQVRVRCSVSDQGLPTVVEAAIDDFRLVDDPDGAPTARFLDVPERYIVGSSASLQLQLLDAAPPGANVVFQTWSHTTERIEAAFPDFTAPFVYPATLLDQVPLGVATVQAIVRDANSQPVEVISRQVFITDDTPPLGDVDGDGSVTVSDLMLLLQSWGACPPVPDPCPADLDGDQLVGDVDLAILLEELY